MTLKELEAKVVALEKEIAELRTQLNHAPKPKEPWWVTEAGKYANDPAYDEAMRLGSEYRESLHPDRRKKKKKAPAKKHAHS